MISFKNNIKKSTSSFKVIVVCLLLSGSLTQPSFANGVNQYRNSWQKVSGTLTADDELGQRLSSGTGDTLVDTYELFDVPVDAEVSIYVKSNDEGTGLCDPALVVYDVNDQDPNSSEFVSLDDGLGVVDDGYDGDTCVAVDPMGEFKDAFLAIQTVGEIVSNFRFQVTAQSIFQDNDEDGVKDLTEYNSGAYTLYVSVGRAVLTSNISSDNSPWVGAQSVTCAAPNPWVKEKLKFARNVKPVLITAENTVGKTINQGSSKALRSSGVVFDTVSKKVFTATETLPIYGCKDKLLSGKVNQAIQFIAGGYKLQSDAHGYIKTADLKWHDTNGVTLYTNTAAFMHTIKFTKTGKYVVVLTEQPDTSRGLIPTYGVRSIRFVININ